MHMRSVVFVIGVHREDGGVPELVGRRSVSPDLVPSCKRVIRGLGSSVS